MLRVTTLLHRFLTKSTSPGAELLRYPRAVMGASHRSLTALALGTQLLDDPIAGIPYSLSAYRSSL